MRSFVGWSLIRPLHPPALLYEDVHLTMPCVRRVYTHMYIYINTYIHTLARFKIGGRGLK